MTWRVAYWEDECVVIRDSSAWAWRALPTKNVLWVDLVWGSEPWRQRLQGRDRFWVDPPLFGAFNDRENWPAYGGDPGAQWDTYLATEHGAQPALWPARPDGVRVLAGVLLPDSVWEEVSRAYPLVLA